MKLANTQFFLVLLYLLETQNNLLIPLVIINFFVRI
jgi:hypothetical protein